MTYTSLDGWNVPQGQHRSDAVESRPAAEGPSADAAADGRARLRRGLDRALSRGPFQPLFVWRASRRLAVLAYHDIDDRSVFRQHLDLLRVEWNPVSLDDVIAAVDGDHGLPRRAVLITFDDGDRTVHDVAMPLLIQRGLPAVTFVVSSVIGTEGAFWWDDVTALIRRGATMDGLPAEPSDAVRHLKRVPDADRRRAIAALRAATDGPPYRSAQLAAEDLRRFESSGIAIGNHTATHPCLTRCSDGVVRREIGDAHERLTELLGAPPRSFAYPNGDADDRCVDVLRSLGYRVGFLFDHRHARMPPTDRFRVSRLRIDASASPERLRAVLSGLHPAIHRLLRRA